MSEAQKPTRGVPVELDRTRYFRFPVRALKQFREGGEVSLTQILLVGLRGDDPELTEEMLDDLVDLENLPTIADAVKKATSGILDLTRMFKLDSGVKAGPPAPPPAAGKVGEVEP